MGKKVLVAGGAGFLGSHLCERLIRDGHSVICVDNLYTGSMDNISNLMSVSGFQFIRHDMCDPIDIPCDQIYNLACPASPVHYQRDPVFTMKTSVFGAIHLLELAKRYGACILQASTSEIYGDPERSPQREDYWGNVNPISIRSCYDEGKRAAEALFFDYYRTRGVDIKVMRIFNTYGPRMNPADGRVVSNFIVQALLNRNITVYGDGSQTRSFCYVDDLIEGMVRLMNSRKGFIGPVNIGNPNEFTVKQLAELVIELTGTQAKIVYEALPQDDPRRRRPDIALAQKELNWTPKVQLLEGLEKTIAYFRQILSPALG